MATIKRNQGEASQEAPVTKVVTTPIRVAYVNIVSAKVWPDAGPDDKPKYNLFCLLPKTDVALVKKIRRAITAANAVGAAEWKGKNMRENDPKFWEPLRDGDTDPTYSDKEGFEGHYFINASSTIKPNVVDRDLEAILDRDEIYSGMKARVSINFAAFGKKGNGIAAYLGNVQKWADAPRFSTGATAEQDFGDDYDEDEPAPKKVVKKKPADDFDEDDEEAVPKKKKKPVYEDDDEDDEPAPKKKKKPVYEDDEDDEPAPKKKLVKKPVFEDDEDDEPAPKKKKKPIVDDDEDQLAF